MADNKIDRHNITEILLKVTPLTTNFFFSIYVSKFKNTDIFTLQEIGYTKLLKTLEKSYQLGFISLSPDLL